MEELSTFEKAKKIKEDWASFWKRKSADPKFDVQTEYKLLRIIRKNRKKDEKRDSISLTIDPNEFTLEEAIYLGFEKQENGLMLIPKWLCPFLKEGIELVLHGVTNTTVIYKFSEVDYINGLYHLELGCYLQSKNANTRNSYKESCRANNAREL